MAENSKIEWTDHTFNPWFGCQKVSPACANCYAEVATPVRVSRSIGLELWGPQSVGAVRRVNSETEWNKVKRWNKQAGETGKRAKVFCSSMADIFEDYTGKLVNHKGEEQFLVDHTNPTTKQDMNWSSWKTSLTNEDIPLSLTHVRYRLFKLIESTPNLDWLLLTKRPENVRSMAPWGNDWPDNVWMGTTVENQKYADLRIPELMRIPAKIRFLSCEPLMSPLMLDYIKTGTSSWIDVINGQIVTHSSQESFPTIDWVIAGGESGPNARPSHPDWYIDLRNLCKQGNIPFFFKQWGEWMVLRDSSPAIIKQTVSESTSLSHAIWDGKRYDTVEYDEDDNNIVYVKVGKKVSGRMLQGKLYNQFPKVK